ncbi:MAG: DUF2147 domain-containing protein [Chitinophagaceae bacterium]
MGNKGFKIIWVFFVVFFNCTRSYAQKGEDIVGTWISDQRNVMVDIYADSSFFKAKVIWFNDADDLAHPMHVRTDTRNPDKSLRNRLVIGMDVLHGLKFDAKCDCWENGKIYDVLTGRTWNATISLDNINRLKVRGFWHYEFIGRSMYFRRVKY